MRRAPVLALSLIVAVSLLAGCGSDSSPSRPNDRAASPLPPFAPDAVAAALGAMLEAQPAGVWEATLPRDDLHASRGATPVQAAFDQESEIDFLPSPDAGQTSIMGEIASTEAEADKLIPALGAAGFTVTAVHHHLTMLTPPVEWTHFTASGDAVALGGKLHGVLQQTTATPLPAKEGAKDTTLPAPELASTLGGESHVSDGVVEVSVDRGDEIAMNGRKVPSGFGLDGLVYFQPLPGGQAATTGEVCLIGGEVSPVVSALQKAGLVVTALHSHMLDTSPPTFFVHWWGTGSPTTLATQVRGVLDQANFPKKG
jgi:hypothetical protein